MPTRKQTKAALEAGPPAAEGHGPRTAAAPPPPAREARVIQIPRVLTVKELGEIMGVPPVEVIKELIKNGVMASINQSIDFETAAIVAHDLGFEPVEERAAEEREEA